MAKIAIIGAGISGISVANMLQDKHHEVRVFEKDDKIGGLVKCDRINDNLFHKVGGHVFNTKEKEVADWFWSHFDKDKEFVKAERNAKIYMGERYIGYPIENYIFQLDPDIVKSIIQDLLQVNRVAGSRFENFEEFLKGNFGKTLYDLYFGPYNNKIWNVDLSQVPLEWLEGKLPMPNISQILYNNIIKKEESEMVHATFYYAKEGGSQFIIERLAEGLHIETNYHLKEIHFNNGMVTLNGEESFHHVIYTGDIRKLGNIHKGSNAYLSSTFDSIKDFKSNGTSNLFCETDDNDLSWLYIPEPNLKAHRIIYTGNFSPSNNRGSQRKTCVVEFSGKCDYETMCMEIKKLPGNLKPLSFNYEPNSYIIQDKETRARISAVKSNLKKEHIYILGRFAEWEYYNMDKAIEAAFECMQNMQ